MEDVFELGEIEALVDKKEYINEKFARYKYEDKEIQEEIVQANNEGIDLTPYLDQKLHYAQLRQIRLGLEKSIAVELYGMVQFNWKQMQELRLGLEHHIDIMPYYNVLFSSRQMHEIRIGLEDGVDVSSYANLMYSASDMKRKLKEILKSCIQSVSMNELIEQDALTGITVRISSDRMKAYLKMPADAGDSISQDYLLHVLRDNGVVYGYCMKSIEMLAQHNHYQSEVLVALGTNIIKGEPGRYQFYFNTKLPSGPKVLPDGRVEYLVEHIFDKVTKGQKIAEYIPPRSGKNGMTVTGIELIEKKAVNKKVLQGNGFTVLEDGLTYVSKKDGFIRLSNGKIEISDILTIEGDVDIQKGNITYEGSILITGSIRDGMIVKAGKSIIVQGSVESACLEAGEDILVMKGVVEQGRGHMIAGGNIRGEFFENATLVSENNIEANYFFRCNLMAGKSIIAKGTKGRIIGGNVQAIQSIESAYLGNPARTQTIVELGRTKAIASEFDELLKEKDQIQKELDALLAGKLKVKAMKNNFSDQYIHLLNKIILAAGIKQREFDVVSDKIDKLDKKLKGADKSYLKVTGSLYEGNTIMINDVTKHVEQELRSVKIIQRGKFLVREEKA